jgi:hypothetical protein
MSLFQLIGSPGATVCTLPLSPIWYNELVKRPGHPAERVLRNPDDAPHGV